MFDFFDRYPRFARDEGGGHPDPRRLNLRWLGMIGAQSGALAGKRVMEAGCWNGRWLFAALQAGASHVVGTEEMPQWAERARSNLEALGVPKDRYTILTGNFFEHIAKADFEIDTLLVPGFVGMGLRNFSVFDHFRESRATCMIFDDWVFPGADPIVQLRRSGEILHAVPSSAAIELYAATHSLARLDFDYAAVLGPPSEAERALFAVQGLGALPIDPIIDYKLGARITVRFTKALAR